MTPLPPVLDKLVETGRLGLEQAQAIVEEHRREGRTIRDVAVDAGFVPEPAFLAAVAFLLDARIVDLAAAEVAAGVVQAVPAAIARLYRVVPIKADDRCVTVAVADYPSPAEADDLAFALSRSVEFVVAPKAQLEEALARLHGDGGDPVEELLSDIGAGWQGAGDAGTREGKARLEDLEHAANATPVIRFVNLVLYQAVKDHASDIHFEPFEDEFKIRYRVDGALYELAPPPRYLALPIISRIKVIAGLDIAETRLPQDGRIQLAMAGRSIDFRVSTLPTQSGESVVLRVLDRANIQLDLDRIGFPDDVAPLFLEDIRKPNGIVVVTGPTGSGKTTTLYAALQRINRTETKILTAEDPVEYDVDGIVQLPVRENIGLDFATALRAFLRQDPDVIMVGEIRDLETAQIAIQAALTGHLVFSTLHTNDAPGAVTRLVDMGVEPYLVASTLEAVLAQRLVRTICGSCRTAYAPDETSLALLDLDPAQTGGQPFHRGTGCPACSGTGYSGRRALFEYLRVNDALRTAIANRQPANVLRRKAVELGMRTLREDGIRCILDGVTTVEEVVRYT